MSGLGRGGSSALRKRVLVVDDDALVLRSLVRILRSEFEVVVAVDATDAIAKIADDLHGVITDHDLGPAGDGRAVLAETRIRAPNARRILMSGRAQSPRAGDEDLWNAFLLKPISRTELFATLRVGTDRTQ